MNAIRQTTGDGFYDNYIVEHHLWTPRNPVIATGEEAAGLHKHQKILAAQGRYLLEIEKNRWGEAMSEPLQKRSLLLLSDQPGGG